MASGTGRVLYPEYYAMEIYLRFNLPPLHILKQNFIPEMVQSALARKEYPRRGDKIERQQRKLKYASISASIGNFRNREEEKFHGVKC